MKAADHLCVGIILERLLSVRRRRLTELQGLHKVVSIMETTTGVSVNTCRTWQDAAENVRLGQFNQLYRKEFDETRRTRPPGLIAPVYAPCWVS